MARVPDRSLLEPLSGSSNQKISSSLLLQRFPQEMVLAVAEHLQPHDIVSFSLSCKALFVACTPLKSTPLEDFEKHRLLETLERDLANTFCFCASCNRLLSCGSTPFASIREPESLRTWGSWCEAGQYDSSYTWWNNGLLLSYHLCRSILNRHFYGPSSGLPLEILNSSAHKINPEYSGLRETLGWEVAITAKIIQDELFLQVTRILTIPDYEKSGHGLDFGRLYLCCRDSEKWFSNEHFGQARTSADLISALDRHSNGRGALSCSGCLSDFTYDIQTKGREWIITIHGYHSLGAFESPEDPRWVTFVNPNRGRPGVSCDEWRTEEFPVKKQWDDAVFGEDEQQPGAV